MIQGIPSLDPVIGLLSKELQINNVPPGQESQYFQSKGRPLDPRILFMIQANEIENKNKNTAQKPTSTVFDDKSSGLTQLANTAVGQQAQPQMQQGVAGLPIGNLGGPKGMAGGGIVAFSGEDEDSEVVADPEGDEFQQQQQQEAAEDAESNRDLDAVGGDNTYSDASTGQGGIASLQNPTAPSTPDASAAPSAQDAHLGDAASQYFAANPVQATGANAPIPSALSLAAQRAGMSVDQYRDMLKAGGADVNKVDLEERARLEARPDVINTNANKMAKLALSQAMFESVGKHTNIWRQLGDIGEHYTGAMSNIESQKNAAIEQSKEAVYNVKRADALQNAGYTNQAMQLKQKAVEDYTTAQAKANAANIAQQRIQMQADRAKQTVTQRALAAAEAGTPAAQHYRNVIAPLEDQISREQDPVKRAALQTQLNRELKIVADNPAMFNPSAVSAGVRAGASTSNATLRASTQLAIKNLEIAAKGTANDKAIASKGAIAELDGINKRLRDPTLPDQEKAQLQVERDAVTTQLHNLNKGAPPAAPAASAASVVPPKVRPPLGSFGSPP